MRIFALANKVFFEMAEAKSGWIPLRFHHRIDTKKGNG